MCRAYPLACCAEFIHVTAVGAAFADCSLWANACISCVAASLSRLASRLLHLMSGNSRGNRVHRVQHMSCASIRGYQPPSLHDKHSSHTHKHVLQVLMLAACLLSSISDAVDAGQFAMTVSFSSVSLHCASILVDTMCRSTHSNHANDAAQHFRWYCLCYTAPFIKATPAFHMFCHDSSSECCPLPASAAAISTDQLQVTVTPWTCTHVNATSLMCATACKCTIA